jgi:large subunit ribosomal protein L5
VEKKYKYMEKLKEKYTNIMSRPKVVKVVVNVGTGRIRDNKDAISAIEQFLPLITAQHIAPRVTKKAISSFKVRQGETVGYSVTLRGKRMRDFISRLVNLAIPRMRDFRGISLRSVDSGGNLTFGVREHIVFPEAINENVRHLFGFEITVVTSASNRQDAIALLREEGFPLEHDE